MPQFNLPDLGEGLEEAEIVAWFVNEGDHVVVDQPLVSVETDKAVVEVPSPQSGRIAHLFGAKGDLVKVGAPLVEFAEGAREDSGTVVGEIDRGERVPRAAEPGAEPARPRTLAVLPAIRALARKLDVDLNLVQATGAGGTVTRADVERAAKSLVDAGPAEPLRGMRRAMAQRMAAAHAEVARTTVTDEADIDAWKKGDDITIRLVRAIAAAAKAEPSLNAWYNAQAGERRLIKRIDIGIAVDRPAKRHVEILPRPIRTVRHPVAQLEVRHAEVLRKLLCRVDQRTSRFGVVCRGSPIHGERERDERREVERGRARDRREVAAADP